MIIFGLMGCLVLALVFLIIRGQSAQADLNKSKFELKTLQKHTQFSLNSIVLLAKQLSHSYREKLEDMRRHGTLHGDDYAVVQFIVENLEFVMSQCCEKQATVEEALKLALEGANVDIIVVQQYIARQPVSVRVPWSKNTLSGYLAACHNLLMSKGQSSDSTVEDINL